MWDLIWVMLGYLRPVVSPRMSQTLMTLSRDPTAMYLELGEKAQVLREEGFFFGIGAEVVVVEFVFQFFCAEQEHFSVLSAAGDDFVYLWWGVLLWLMLTALMKPLW